MACARINCEARHFLTINQLESFSVSWARPHVCRKLFFLKTVKSFFIANHDESRADEWKITRAETKLCWSSFQTSFYISGPFNRSSDSRPTRELRLSITNPSIAHHGSLVNSLSELSVLVSGNLPRGRICLPFQLRSFTTDVRILTVAVIANNVRWRNRFRPGLGHVSRVIVINNKARGSDELIGSREAELASVGWKIRWLTRMQWLQSWRLREKLVGWFDLLVTKLEFALKTCQLARVWFAVINVKKLVDWLWVTSLTSYETSTRTVAESWYYDYEWLLLRTSRH